jgi:hypothetical protein
MLEGKCYFCGKGGHQSPVCHLEDKILNEELAINKAKAQEPTEQSSHNNAKSSNSKEIKLLSTYYDTSSEEGWTAAHDQCYQAKEMKNWILLDKGSMVDLFCNLTWLLTYNQLMTN